MTLGKVYEISGEIESIICGLSACVYGLAFLDGGTNTRLLEDQFNTVVRLGDPMLREILTVRLIADVDSLGRRHEALMSEIAQLKRSGEHASLSVA